MDDICDHGIHFNLYKKYCRICTPERKKDRIEARVKRRFEREGWTTFITGLPDLWAFREKPDKTWELIVREVKGPNDKPTFNQTAFITYLRRVGIDAKIQYVSKDGETVLSEEPSCDDFLEERRASNAKRKFEDLNEDFSDNASLKTKDLS